MTYRVACTRLKRQRRWRKKRNRRGEEEEEEDEEVEGGGREGKERSVKKYESDQVGERRIFPLFPSKNIDKISFLFDRRANDRLIEETGSPIRLT